jgi:ribosomal protein S18
MQKVISPFTGPKQKKAPGSRPCPFCKGNILGISWADYPTLKNFTDYFGNIKKRYYTGACLKHQKSLHKAVERARFMGLIAFRK